MPDSVFVEDMAIVFDELAILTRPGADSRRREMPAIATALAAYRPLQEIQPPATVDGGDVLVAGRRVFVGRSTRTNEAAVIQIRRILGPFGYTITETDMRGCLHLKSAVTVLDDERLLVNPEWIDAAAFDGFTLVDVAPEEPSAANALRLDRSCHLSGGVSANSRASRGTRPADRARGGERACESRRRGHVLQRDSREAVVVSR